MSGAMYQNKTSLYAAKITQHKRVRRVQYRLPHRALYVCYRLTAETYISENRFLLNLKSVPRLETLTIFINRISSFVKRYGMVRNDPTQITCGFPTKLICPDPRFISVHIPEYCGYNSPTRSYGVLVDHMSTSP